MRYQPDENVVNRALRFAFRAKLCRAIAASKIALDFENVVEEIIAHLREPGTELVVNVEIEATDAIGFDESKIRAESENAHTLEFDQSWGFEEN